MKRPYGEIMDDVQLASYGKECRILHKELKRDYNDGLPLFMRYPNFPIIISIIAGVLIMISGAIFPIIVLLAK